MAKRLETFFLNGTLNAGHARVLRDLLRPNEVTQEHGKYFVTLTDELKLSLFPVGRDAKLPVHIKSNISFPNFSISIPLMIID